MQLVWSHHKHCSTSTYAMRVCMTYQYPLSNIHTVSLASVLVNMQIVHIGSAVAICLIAFCLIFKSVKY